jgi:hypothetical protein
VMEEDDDMYSPLSLLRLLIAIGVAALIAYAVAAAQPLPNAAESVFRDRLASYVSLRTDLARLAELPLEPTDERTAVMQRRRLGTALRVMRAEVQQGNIFGPPVAPLFRQIVGAALEDDALRTWVEARSDAASHVAQARVNGSLPIGAEHDVYPSLLRVLPPLPRGIEYRVVHDDLLLWDIGADVVIDVLPGVFHAETI